MFVPVFPVDAKALADEVTDVLCAPFPLVDDVAISWVSQTRCDGLTYSQRLEQVAAMIAGEQRRVLVAQVQVAVTEQDPDTSVDHAELSAYADLALALQ